MLYWLHVVLLGDLFVFLLYYSRPTLRINLLAYIKVQVSLAHWQCL